MENLTFILTCLAIFAAIMLVAAFLQKKLCRDIKAFSGTHYITYTAIFAAMGMTMAQTPRRMSAFAPSKVKGVPSEISRLK